jgi:hypothetical protein
MSYLIKNNKKLFLLIIILLCIILVSIFLISNRKTINNFKSKTKIPIFVIVHDRIKVLKKTLDSFNKYIKTPYEIIFFDTKSTYKPCIDYLKKMEENNYKVYWSGINDHNLIMNAVYDYKKNNNFKYFVITDPDIELDNVNGDILEYYIYLLNKYKVIGVGPMLRIDDIPNHYPRKKNVIEGHTRQFWHKKPKEIKYNNKKYNIQFSGIDTTFQLCSIDNIPNKFPNKNCIRCYAPYSARHLDWYLNPDILTEDQIYYSKNARGGHHSKGAHWGRQIHKE